MPKFQLGRFHLIRVILALVFVILFITIVSKRQEDNSTINLKYNPSLETSLSWPELENKSQVNSTCPLCFGRDACEELMNDVTKGTLQVSRNAQVITDLGQTVQGIYRNGKVRFWMKPQPPSPSLLKMFESYICVKAGNLYIKKMLLT